MKLLENLKNKSVHIVGVTGAEGSSILRLLTRLQFNNLTTHDFLEDTTLEKSYKLWHKGVDAHQKEKLYSQFTQDLIKTSFYTRNQYLKNILSADLIFIPQSWRLYKKQNKPLWMATKKRIPFYSLSRLYLDFAPGLIIGITGTVGKGSVAYILYQILKKSGKSVYFAGNDTWMIQLADKLPDLTAHDLLILEISHRQLMDGFEKAPHITLCTNILPNHLDEVSWQEYKETKLSLLLKQKRADISILNYADENLRQISKKLLSKIVFYSDKYKYMNTKSIQNIYDYIMNTKINHYEENILAASTIANILNVTGNQVKNFLPKILSLPARTEKISTTFKIHIVDDIKSTTPWSALKALSKYSPDVTLICGGFTKGLNYQQFFIKAKEATKTIIIIKSDLSHLADKILGKENFILAQDLKDALFQSLKKVKPSSTVLISPAAAFFYSKFIKNKLSIKRIITSLLPEVQTVGEK